MMTADSMSGKPAQSLEEEIVTRCNKSANFWSSASMKETDCSYTEDDKSQCWAFTDVIYVVG